MGQNQGASCTQPEQDIFLQQLGVYQWRADTNLNTFLPRVYFKSAFAQLQQQKFQKFLEQQTDKQYFQLSKFKQQLQCVPNLGDDQVVVFQKYQYSLAEIPAKLALQQALYTLQGLLTGYEQIKKVFQMVIIDASCCFITVSGSIRAWINPNVKINRIWKEHEGESINRNIVQRTVIMVQEYTEISKLSENFFRSILYNIRNKQLKNCSFSELRKWINEYCYYQNIQIAKKINLVNKRQKEARNNFSKIRRINTPKTEASQFLQHRKQNNNLFSTHSSQIERVRSMQKKIQISAPVFQVRNMNIPSSPVRLTSSHGRFQLHQSPYRVMAINISPQQTNYPSLVQTITQPNIPNFHNFSTTLTPQRSNQNIRNIQLSQSKIKETLSKQQISPLGSKKTTQVIAQNKSSNQNVVASHQKIKDEVNPKKALELSIMQNIVETNQVRKETRHRTYAEKQISEKQSNAPESFCYSRPWITTKTVTKLISDHQQNYSVKNSIAQSSDYYNGSVYSGVLTQMGRQVRKRDSEGRSRTLGISQQL